MPEDIAAVVRQMAAEGALYFSHRKDLRHLGEVVHREWNGLDREERLYNIWFNARAYRTALIRIMGRDDAVEAALFLDTARVCARLFERAYGEAIDVERDDWGAFTDDERYLHSTCRALPAPPGMRAPAS